MLVLITAGATGSVFTAVCSADVVGCNVVIGVSNAGLFVVSELLVPLGIVVKVVKELEFKISSIPLVGVELMGVTCVVEIEKV